MPRIACWRSAGERFCIACTWSCVGPGVGARRRRHAGRLGDAQDLGAQGRQPGRIGRRARFQLAPALQRRRAVAALRLVQAEIEQRARIVGVLRQRLVQRLDGGRRHRAAGLDGQRLGQRRQRLRVVGIFGELGAGRGDDVRRRAAPAPRAARGRAERRRGQAGMADREIEPEREQRDHQAKRRRHEAVERRLQRQPDLGVALGGGEDAALDFYARGSGLRFGHRAGRALALELGQLVAIDGEVVVQPIGRLDAGAQQRDQQRADRGGGEEGEKELKHLRWERATPWRSSLTHERHWSGALPAKTRAGAAPRR